MSKFYGQVFGASVTSASRRGFEDIKVSAQSYDGSLITMLSYNDKGELIVQLSHSDGSEPYGERVFYGTMDKLLETLKGGM